MIWHTSEILARPSLRLRAALAQIPDLKGFTYLLHGTLPVVSERARSWDGLPEEGLLVVRPIGDPTWMKVEDGPVRSWHDWPGPGARLDNAPGMIERGSLDDETEVYPPAAFLGVLKLLARQTETTLAYYYGATWGGDVDIEHSWLFGPAGEERALVTVGEDRHTSVYVDGHLEQTLESGLLQQLLEPLGVRLPGSGQFPPNERPFDWAPYALESF